MKAWVLGACVAFAPLFLQAAEKSEKIDWKNCEKELKDYDCKGTDEEIWLCLDRKGDNVGELCQKEHRKGDKQYGGAVPPSEVKELR